MKFDCAYCGKRFGPYDVTCGQCRRPRPVKKRSGRGRKGIKMRLLAEANEQEACRSRAVAKLGRPLCVRRTMVTDG